MHDSFFLATNSHYFRHKISVNNLRLSHTPPSSCDETPHQRNRSYSDMFELCIHDVKQNAAPPIQTSLDTNALISNRTITACSKLKSLLSTFSIHSILLLQRAINSQVLWLTIFNANWQLASPCAAISVLPIIIADCIASTASNLPLRKYYPEEIKAVMLQLDQTTLGEQVYPLAKTVMVLIGSMLTIALKAGIDWKIFKNTYTSSNYGLQVSAIIIFSLHHLQRVWLYYIRNSRAMRLHQHYRLNMDLSANQLEKLVWISGYVTQHSLAKLFQFISNTRAAIIALALGRCFLSDIDDNPTFSTVLLGIACSIAMFSVSATFNLNMILSKITANYNLTMRSYLDYTNTKRSTVVLFFTFQVAIAIIDFLTASRDDHDVASKIGTLIPPLSSFILLAHIVYYSQKSVSETLRYFLPFVSASIPIGLVSYLLLLIPTNIYSTATSAAATTLSMSMMIALLKAKQCSILQQTNRAIIDRPFLRLLHLFATSLSACKSLLLLLASLILFTISYFLIKQNSQSIAQETSKAFIAGSGALYLLYSFFSFINYCSKNSKESISQAMLPTMVSTASCALLLENILQSYANNLGANIFFTALPVFFIANLAYNYKINNYTHGSHGLPELTSNSKSEPTDEECSRPANSL